MVRGSLRVLGGTLTSFIELISGWPAVLLRLSFFLILGYILSFVCLTIWANGIVNKALWVNKSKNISDQKGSSSLLAVWVEESLPSPYIKGWADQGQVSVLLRLWVVLISGLWLRAWEVRFFRHEGWWRSPSAHQSIPSPSTASTPGKCLQRRWSNVLGAGPFPSTSASQAWQHC